MCKNTIIMAFDTSKTNVSILPAPTVNAANLLLSLLVVFFFHPLSSSPLFACQHQCESRRPRFSKLDLECWYQELMAGSSQLSSPTLPFKSLPGRRSALQVDTLSFSSSSSFSFIFPYSHFCFFCFFCRLVIQGQCVDLFVCAGSGNK